MKVIRVMGTVIIAVGICAAQPRDPDSVSALADTSTGQVVADTSLHADTADAQKTGTVVLQSPPKQPPAPADTRPDSFDVFSGMTLGAGVAMSLGSMPVLNLWKNGLPERVDELGLNAAFTDDAGDTVSFQYRIKERPDIYNMTFPLTLSVSRLREWHRLSAAVSFSMLAKSFYATAEADTLRRIDIKQSMRYYAVVCELLYGRRIPEYYFLVDRVQRTDAIAGIAVAPFIGLRKSSSANATVPDAPFGEACDSIAASLNSFSSRGIALSWRLGICMLRRASKNGGIETTLSYQGLWCIRFTTNNGELRNRDIHRASDDPESGVSWFSNRFDITFALVRKIL
ncbi:MAG: hypothetical protein JW768_10720 [Chitinispirillaceae bacterium]|nr:hypothetical protein [Chitinispirillaceae bacterium]